MREISTPPGFDPRTVQPVASHIDYALKKTTTNISQGSRVEIQPGGLPNTRLECFPLNEGAEPDNFKAVLTKIFS